MKNAFLVLAFIILVLAMLGGPSSITGNYVTPIKSQALKTASEISVLDKKIHEQEFIININKLLSNDGTPTIKSGSDITLELDFSFLEDQSFLKLDDYVNLKDLKAYIIINGQKIESRITPSGFLKYTCRFSVPEYNGSAVIGYKTRNWDKNKQVVVSTSEGLTIDNALRILGL